MAIPFYTARLLRSRPLTMSSKLFVTDMYETMDAGPRSGSRGSSNRCRLRVFTYQMENEDGVPARGCIVNPRLTLGKVSAAEPTPMTKKKGVFRSRATVFLSNVLSGLLSMDLMSKAIRSGLRQPAGLTRCMQHETDHLDGKLYVNRT